MNPHELVVRYIGIVRVGLCRIAKRSFDDTMFVVKILKIDY